MLSRWDILRQLIPKEYHTLKGQYNIGLKSYK